MRKMPRPQPDHRVEHPPEPPAGVRVARKPRRADESSQDGQPETREDADEDEDTENQAPEHTGAAAPGGYYTMPILPFRADEEQDLLTLDDLREIAEANGWPWQPTGDGFLTTCPAHDDMEPSLSVVERDGVLLLHCFAGCPGEEVIRAFRELREGELGGQTCGPGSPVRISAAASASEGLTVEELAGAKGIPADFLVREFGLRTALLTNPPRKGVVIPYSDTDGRALFERVRESLRGKPKQPRGVPLVPYGLWKLAEARQRGKLHLVEGESDTWTLALHGVPALGIPGAQAVRTLQPEHLEGIQLVVVHQESDGGGRQFVTGLQKRLQEIGWQGQALVVRYPPEAKDANALHLHRREDFLKVLESLPRERLLLRPELVVYTASEVEISTPEFLWSPYIPIGMGTLVAGVPDQGKSYLTLKVAAAVSRGWPLPGDEQVRPPGEVVILNLEDRPSDIANRLWKLGADMGRVKIVGGVREVDGTEALPDLTRHLPLVQELVEKYRPALVVLDPIQLYIGAKTDVNRANEVRAALTPVMRLAERYGFALVMVAHLRKGEAEHVLHRVLGSQDFVAAVRSVLVVGEENGSGLRAMAHAKSNLTAKGPGVRFTIDDEGLHWQDGEGEIDPYSLVTVHRQGTDEPEEERSRIGEAVEFLRVVLADGPKTKTEIQAEARRAGISFNTIQNVAKPRLGVVSVRVGKPGGKRGEGTWYWKLPGQPDPVLEEDTQDQAHSLGN